ncbi:MAG: DksA/TraR family C4-type zinc finger protein [Steroidobacteraceae bacterium]|nr:DksA/TraR family C4-type zinc finger protein [Steroidobacteraceae bacterium]
MPVEPALELYFRQCAILVNSADLARMGATLANLGSNPFTGDSVFEVSAVRDTLSVMFTCGMYDYSGHWALDVGIPAKSGVGGGVVGIVNRQLGIGTFSPRLDAKGNSVRGLRVFQQLANEFGLHAFECTSYGSELMRSLACDGPAALDRRRPVAVSLRGQEDRMATGWAGENAVNEQIDATVNDAVRRARGRLPAGESATHCDECGEAIPGPRRAAMPGVRLCLACQDALDRQTPQFSGYNRRGSKDSQLR